MTALDLTPDRDPSASAPRDDTRRSPLPTSVKAGALIVLALSLAAVLGPALVPDRPTAPAGLPLQPPGDGHLLGTTGVGQDVVSQLISGARISLLVAVLAGVGTTAIGTLVGVLAGWRGGLTDAALMRVVDLVLVIPKLPLLILVGAYVGRSLWALSAIIAVTFWPMSARIVRSQVRSLRSRAHVRAAVAFGARGRHVVARHLLPALGPILAAELVFAAFRAVSLEAGLAFLGLGDPTSISWGSMLRAATDFSGLFHTPAWAWWLLPPIVALSLLLLGITLLGIGLERWSNPRLARHGTAA